jgi:hypothetical protein
MYRKFKGHVIDFEKNRYMSRISGNVSLDFCIMQVLLDYS